MSETVASGRAAARPQRLLVVMPSWVGDCVMATPVLRAIRRHYAARDRGFFAAAYLRPPLAPLFAAGDEFDTCIGGRPGGLWGPGREAARLRGYGFDTALLLPNSFRAAWTVRLARIPRRIGYARDRRGWLLSDARPCPSAGGWRAPIALLDYYRALVAPLGIDPRADPAPRLLATRAELGRVRSLMADAGFSPRRPLVLLNPGASRAQKCWPAANFAALAERLYADRGVQIVINGGPGEQALTAELAAHIRGAPVLDLGARETSLATLLAACTLADLVVSNDTGTRHIAAAAGFEGMRFGARRPALVTMFGTVPPEWTTLNYPHEKQLYDREAGRVDAIGLEPVLAACRELLASRA